MAEVALKNPPTEFTEKERSTVLTPDQLWTDEYALKVVTADFNEAQNYRIQHERRWREADTLYLAWVQERTWPGTKVPRASLGIPIAFEQIESILPKMMSAIFSDPDWAEATALPGTTPQEAREVAQLVLYQLRYPDENGVPVMREVVRRALKSALTRGNGFVEIGWTEFVREVLRKMRVMVPDRRAVDTILGRATVTIGMKPMVREDLVPMKVSRPFVKYVSIWDLYIDPNVGGPVLQGTESDSPARFVIKRSLLSVDEVDKFRKTPGFSIPPKAELLAMAKNHPSVNANMGKNATDNMRGITWDSSKDSSADPASKRIEVLAYQTPYREVWTLDRRHAAYNKPNPFGFIRFYDAYYTDVLDRCYGLSICDVVEGEQRLQQGLINARLDEVALKLSNPATKRRGLNQPASNQRLRPNALIEINEKDDYTLLQLSDIAPDAHIEVAASDVRAQKATGASDLGVLGVPTPGGNAAARTATGSAIQAGASQSRIEYPTENNCDTFLVPILHGIHTMNKVMLDPLEVQRIVNPKGDELQVDPMAVINANVCFHVRAGAKLRAKNMLQQTFPQFVQYITAPEFMKQIALQYGLKPDLMEIVQVWMDISGYQKRGDWFVPMKEEEMQQLMQPAPEEMLRMQMQRERIQGQKEEGVEDRAARLVETILKGLLAGASKESEPKKPEKPSE